MTPDMKRTATVTLALCVLASAATASAESAWVLWTDTTKPSGQRTWEVGLAFPDYDDCQAAVSIVRVTEKKPDVARIEKKGDDTFLAYFHDGTVGTLRFVCLPDTVDPRGPKGR